MQVIAFDEVAVDQSHEADAGAYQRGRPRRNRVPRCRKPRHGCLAACVVQLRPRGHSAFGGGSDRVLRLLRSWCDEVSSEIEFRR